MGVTHGRIALYVINGVDLSKRTTDGDLDQKRKVDSVEVSGDGGVIKVVGASERNLKLKGVQDAAVVAEMQARYDAADVVPFSVKFQGPDGAELSGNCIVSEFSYSASGSKAATWSAELTITDEATVV